MKLEAADKAQLSKAMTLIAHETGKIVNNYFRQLPGTELKEDKSLVTVADKLAEEKAREIIMREFPEHGILGEEFGQHNPDSPYQWVIDPIDGTTSFVAGAFDFGSV
ncbi:MAG: inositol monophosphatase family protein, partial [Coleofasciculaceae cyanobacterium]